jgi:DNA polymerase-3 subunit epsilon
VSASWWRRFAGAGREAWDETVFWALDLETSGFDPRREEILAVGMVPIRGGSIRWGERFASLVQPVWPGAALGAGLGAHHLLPGEVAGGLSLTSALEQVLMRVSEGVLLVHFAALDVEFLRRACLASGCAWPRPRVVDTARLLEQMARFEYPKPAPPGNLAAARERFGLPPAEEHDALADALSTAELFLVLRHRLRAGTVGELV